METLFDINSQIYSFDTVIINLVLSFILGLLISYVYRKTHKGLSYSQSFIITAVLVTVIVAMVIMIIGNNLARAFALVGALSIIRFRTVVKDTKDTAYIFWSLAAGMAAGTGWRSGPPARRDGRAIRGNETTNEPRHRQS